MARSLSSTSTNACSSSARSTAILDVSAGNASAGCSAGCSASAAYSASCSASAGCSAFACHTAAGSTLAHRAAATICSRRVSLEAAVHHLRVPLLAR